MSASNLYHADFYAWAQEQAALLRAGNLAADIAHIAEEIESMGRTEKRELVRWSHHSVGMMGPAYPQFFISPPLSTFPAHWPWKLDDMLDAAF